MMITPLVRLAAARIPALTDLFSDTLSLTSMVVTQGGTTVLTTAVAHGVNVGEQIAVCIVDAFQPNAITGLEFLDGPGGDIIVTVSFEHNLTTTPDATLYQSWDAFVRMTGTGVAALEGANIQLVSVPSRTTLVVRPAAPVASLPGAIPSDAVLLERLERDIVGWRPVTAASATTLTFPTPNAVTRSYAVASPKVCKNIRAWGAVDLQHAMRHFNREDEADNEVALDQCYLFVTPPRTTRLSRDRFTRSDAMAEITPTADFRQMLLDGFEIHVAMPAERYGGAVSCVDRAQGPILSAVLKTFNGLRLYRPELAQPVSDYVAFLTDHGVSRYDRANYWHTYRFEAPAQLTNGDTIPPIDIPIVDDIAVAIMNSPPGTSDIPINPVQPAGTVPFDGVWFAPDPEYGIWEKDRPQPLLATFTTDA